MSNDLRRSPRSARGLADLACALATGDQSLIGVMSELLDLEKTDRPKMHLSRSDKLSESGGFKPAAFPQTVRYELEAGRIEPVCFWCLDEYQVLGENGEPEPPAAEDDEETSPEFPLPRQQDLAPWRELQPRLRTALAESRESRELDTEELIRRVGQGRTLQRLPRRRYPGWGPRVRIILDRSTRLTPYWQDQDRVLAALVRLLPAHGVELSVFREGCDAPEMLDKGESRPVRLPAPGTLILVLGDLGCLSCDTDDLRVWCKLGAQWRAAGCRPVALLPAWPLPGHGTLRPYFRLLPWERPRGTATRDQAERDLAVRRLLRLLSPAVRIEPGLLRAVRLSLGTEAPDAGAEAELWQSSALSSRSSVAASLDANTATYFRDQFGMEPEAVCKAALDCLRAWRGDLPREIWCEEVLTLAALGQQEQLPDADDLARARRFYQRLSQRGRGIGKAPPPGALSWYRRCETRLPDSAWRDREAGAALQRLTWVLHKDEPDFAQADRVSPEHTGGGEALRRFDIVHRADRLEFCLKTEVPAPVRGSPIATIASRSGRIRVTPLETGTEFWKAGRQPDWADHWGWDEFGTWVEFVIESRETGQVRQRLRWIPPGRFRMGSPDDKPGRYEDAEGPRHDVFISAGFWLFDTPCTQALWIAVTGANPSHFQSPDRPVENVSWDNCQQFIEQINRRMQGLDLVLPSEAQWEYACRAGKQGAIYLGDFALLGANNAPALDPIAWYGGNSGMSFELDNGYDASDWPEKQYAFKRAGTHPVARKIPNAWGLYDMLGNVWEWCFDGWREYTDQEVEDPMGPIEAGALRVLRGGSWGSGARSVRCACRGQRPPADGNDAFGFRPARVQVREPGRKQAEPATPVSGRQAERRPAQVRPGGAEGVTLRGGEVSAHCIHPETPDFEIVSDSARLTFRQTRRPAWARAMGRDRFGLWAEIEVMASDGEAVVQRVRWIPPGQFRMGSPPDEPGRRDNEGPQTYVTITKGYWIFDTPCTQALWKVIMVDNPSRFQTPSRPVEYVSFEDCERFLNRLNELRPGLELCLPTEAQWEYACRAGTETAIYSGTLTILGDANAPDLDPIAWYAGNSGVDYELKDGEDLSGYYEDRQFQERTAGTHPVALKKPNAWGLYDTLGNVWEWCRDGMRDYGRDPVNDPVGPTSADADRVLRGGSWHLGVRFVRCAYHRPYLPFYRDDSVGFRPVRVQS